MAGYKAVVDRYIKPYPIGSLRLDAVNRTAVASFYAEVLEKGARRRGIAIEPATVRGIHRVLSMILARACDDGLVCADVAGLPIHGGPSDVPLDGLVRQLPLTTPPPLSPRDSGRSVPSL
jgi:hypothetical protein